MLILTMLESELVFVGGPTLITLTKEGHRPRLGFSAHADVPVIRGDVLISMISEELAAKRNPGEEDLLPAERSALEVAYLVLSDPESDPDIIYESLANEPMQELLFSFHQADKKRKAA